MNRWSSIRFKLPFLIILLLVVVIGTASLQAYRHVESAVLAGASERLAAAAGEGAAVLSQSFGAVRQIGDAIVADPEVARFVTARSDEARPYVEARLRSLMGPNVQPTSSMELVSVTGEVVAVAAAPAAGAPVGGVQPAGRTGVSPLRAEGGLLRYEVVHPIAGPDAAAPPLGWLVQRRALASAQTGVLLARFVGQDASILMANDDASVWTDLTDVVEPPPVSGPLAPGFFRYAMPDSSRRAASVARIEGTPFVAWVELPEEDVMAPVGVFLGQALSTAGLLIVVGGLGAWILSRSITRPIMQLATAAGEISSGDYSRRVTTRRNDELGILNAAFNTMAETVEAQHGELEEKVADRTAKLRAAYRKLVETQQELVKKEKLATLGQLASGVGHELRNPLGVMTNAVYYLEMVLQDAPETVVEYLGILKAQIGLSEKIVGDLLDFARVKPPRAEAIQVADLVDAQVARLGSRKNLRIERVIPPDVPPVVIDATQIGQVLLNLLMNGMQAMGETGGTLHIEARVPGDGMVALAFRDEGEGIQPENMEKIFEPLFTTKARGIGLGLAVSLALLEKNRGRMRVESTPGEGATFTVYLPTTPPEPSA